MKKKMLFFTAVIICVAVLTIFIINFSNKQNIKNNIKLNNEKLIEINEHYNSVVLTNKKTILLKKDNDEYIEVGNINGNISLELDNIDIDLNTKYFPIKGLNLYIYYEDVNPSNEYIKSDRYNKYIYFNKNIITKNITSFYDENSNFLFTINQSFDFKVLVNDTDKYGVVYNDQLLYVKSDDVEKVYDNHNTDLKNKNKIRTLTYHAIYNPDVTYCNTSICQTIDMFDSHLKYIRENDYFTLTLEELEKYLDGKIQIPDKSIVLTIDDGTILDQEALKLLEKYQVNATLFVITSLVNPENFKSDYLALESHTHNMHNQYECSGYGSQGGGILCLPEEKVLEDLKTSQDKVGGSKYFAYPFFDFSDRAISLLKKAGFHLAFIGQYDTEGYSYPNKTDKYKVRRMTIFSDTTIEEFKTYLD